MGGRELTLGQGNVKGNTLLRFKAVYCSSLESAVKMLSRFMFLDNRLAWQMWVRDVEYCVYNAVYAGIMRWMLFFFCNLCTLQVHKVMQGVLHHN